MQGSAVAHQWDHIHIHEESAPVPQPPHQPPHIEALHHLIMHLSKDGHPLRQEEEAERVVNMQLVCLLNSWFKLCQVLRILATTVCVTIM